MVWHQSFQDRVQGHDMSLSLPLYLYLLSVNLYIHIICISLSVLMYTDREMYLHIPSTIFCYIHYTSYSIWELLPLKYLGIFLYNLMVYVLPSLTKLQHHCIKCTFVYFHSIVVTNIVAYTCVGLRIHCVWGGGAGMNRSGQHNLSILQREKFEEWRRVSA